MLTNSQYQAQVASLEAAIEPAIENAIQSQRQAILDQLNPVVRFLASRFWSLVVALGPILAKAALTALLAKFATVTVGEIADLLVKHRELNHIAEPKS